MVDYPLRLRASALAFVELDVIAIHPTGERQAVPAEDRRQFLSKASAS